MDEASFAFAWYSETEYKKFQLFSDDPEVWCESYDSWRKNAEDKVRSMRAEGAQVSKVSLTLEEINQWCAMSGNENVSSTRSEYAATKLRSLSAMDN